MSTSKKFCANRGIEGTVVQIGRDTRVHKIGPYGVVSEIEVDRFGPCDEVLVLSGPHSSHLGSGSTHFFIVKKISDGHINCSNGKIGAIRISANDIESEYPSEYPFAYDKKTIKCTSTKTIGTGSDDASKFDVIRRERTIRIISGPHALVGGKYYVCTDEGVCGFVDIADDDMCKKYSVSVISALTRELAFKESDIIVNYPKGSEFLILRGPYRHNLNESSTSIARYLVRSLSDGNEGYLTFSTSELGMEHGEFLPNPEAQEVNSQLSSTQSEALIGSESIIEASYVAGQILTSNGQNGTVSYVENNANKETIAFLSTECESLKSQLKHIKENHAELQEAFSRQAMSMSHVPPSEHAITSEVVDVAYRTAASQLVKLARAPISAGHSHMHEILKTDIGGAMISAFLSIGMMALPENEHTERLRKELRIKSAVDASDAIIDLISGPIRKIISDYASSEADFANAVKCLPESNKIDTFSIDRSILVGNNKNK